MTVTIKFKILFTFLITGLIVIMILGGILYNVVLDYESDRVGEQLKSTAQLVARYMDVETHTMLVEGSENSEEYNEITDYLLGFLYDVGLEYVYTMELNDQEQIIFVADANEEPAVEGSIGYLYETTEACQIAIYEAFAGNPSSTDKPYSDEYGTFMSGFAPVYDASGSVVAVVGVDLSVIELINLTKKLLVIEMICLLVGMGLVVVALVIITSNISKHILGIRKAMKQAENGDLTVSATVYTSDEIGELTESFNSLVENTAGTVRVIHQTMNSLNEASVNMTNIADTMVSASEETNEKVNIGTNSVIEIAHGFKKIDASLSITEEIVKSLSSSVDTINQTVISIAKSAEVTAHEARNTSELVDSITLSMSKTTESAKTASHSVNNVVYSVKEINSSLSEVSTNCSRSMNITKNAKYRTNETSEIIKKLNESTKNISQIIYLIKNVADQTNMLALNAAIEAAGAGESGKGFAVVANEVKELARQTRDATSDIGKQIEEMNEQMESAVSAVSSITSVVDEVDLINNTIAAAVTQQAAITKDMSQSAVQVAEKVSNISIEMDSVYEKAKDVAKNSEQSSKSMKFIADSTDNLSISSQAMANLTEKATSNLREIVQMSSELSKSANRINQTMEAISTSSEEVTASAEDTSNSARQLEQLASKLNQAVSQFKI